MSSYLLKTLTKKEEIYRIRDTIDEVLVLRFGRCTDSICLQHAEILAKSASDVLKFAKVALVDVDSEEAQVYVKTADDTKWVGAFHIKKDFIDVVEKNTEEGEDDDCSMPACPVPPERIPKYQLLYKDV